MIQIYVIGFVIALIVSVLMTPLARKLAFWVGAVDQPNDRKVHTKAMPYFGGIAIYVGFIIAYFIMSPAVEFAWGIALGATIIVIVGALDDRFDLSPKFKLLGQLLAAIAVVASGIQIEFINLPFDGLLEFGWLSIPITIIWIVGISNAVNLIDGLDGLSAGVSGIATAAIFVMALFMGNELVAILSIALLGSILGFLFFNFHPAKIFMGDAGALFLGFNLAVFSMLGFKQVAIVSFLIPIIILGVPIADTFFAIVRRVVNKKPISAADKNHLHHRLIQMGLSHRQTVLVIYGISALFAISALLFSQATMWGSVIIITVLVTALQIGAELIGIVHEERRPVINTVKKLRVKLTNPASKSK